MVRLKHLLYFILLTSLLPVLYGFVLIAGPNKAKLDVSPKSPVAEFAIGDEAPTITAIEEVFDGADLKLSNSALWYKLVDMAMDEWNSVKGSYVQLKTTKAVSPNFDEDDEIHSIVVGEVGYTAAAYANPRVEGSVIVDCDIKVSDSSVAAQDLLYTLVHELGHCLGLGHNHTNYDSLMGYSRGGTSAKLGTDDKAGVIYLYPDPEYSDGATDELIGCGTIGNNHINIQSKTMVLFLLLVPLLLIFIQRLRARLQILK